MSDDHLYMIFGATITVLGFILARNSQVGTGQTIVRIFGAELPLAAAGGIVVMMLGIVAFAMPLLVEQGQNTHYREEAGHASLGTNETSTASPTSVTLCLLPNNE